MKIVILSAIFVISAFASPSSKVINGVEYQKIPNGFGGISYVDVAAEQEVNPAFDNWRDTRFLVFTRFNPTIGQQIVFNNMQTVEASHYSSARPTRFLIHGWQSNVNSDINVLTTAAYLRSYDVNVIVVDWAIGANTINYISSRNQVNPVGAVLAELLDNMHISGHLPNFSRVSLIGHSLGGAAGKRVSRDRINTIIGLDPAGPLFNANEPANRLDATDAHYVEIIHTDNDSFGIGYPLGDADFYPNGGTGMPGCLTSICDHNQVIPYFVETLNSLLLWGRRCTHLAEMNADGCTGHGAHMGGEPSNHRNNLIGIFRLPTNRNSPFGVGEF